MGCLPCASHPFFPLFVASFLIDDFFANEHFFGAGTTGFSSASSKSVIIAAYLRATCEGIHIVGLTSAGNCEFVEGPKRTPFARWASDWLRVERVSGEDRLPEAVARGASNHVWEHPVGGEQRGHGRFLSEFPCTGIGFTVRTGWHGTSHGPPQGTHRVSRHVLTSMTTLPFAWPTSTAAIASAASSSGRTSSTWGSRLPSTTRPATISRTR